MSEEMQGNKGFCAYCGQAVFIQTVGEVGQDELDRMATDKCMCPEAQSERRKKERKEKIDRYVKKHFDVDMKPFVERLIKMVEEQDLTNVTLQLPDDRVCKIWLDSDSYLHIKVKKTDDDELKV